MLLTLFFCLALFDPKLHTGGDNANYVLLAESLLHPAHGYADSWAPGPPVPHTKYPPGYPALLATLIAVFGQNLLLLKLLSVALALGSVALFAQLARERVGPPLWVFLSLAFAVNPLVVDYSHWILSESAFLFFTLLALLFLQREAGEEGLGRYFWLSILAIVATYYVRGIGIVFIGAGSLYYLLRRRWRKFLFYNVVGAALSLPWFIRNELLRGSATPYLEQFLLKSVYTPSAGTVGVGGMIGRILENIWIYAARELPRAFTGSSSAWSAAPLMRALSVVLFVLMVVGFVHTVRRRLGVAELYFAFSWLALLMFEQVVSDVRYVLPLLPLVLFYVADGLSLLAGKLTSLREPPTSAVWAMLLLLAIGVLAQLQRIPYNVAMLRAYERGDRYAGYDPAWRTFFQASDWIRDNTPSNAVVTVRKPRLFYLWTGRKDVLYPFSADPDTVLQAVLPTDYVIVDEISGTTPRYLVPALRKDPDRFQVVFQTETPRTWVLRVKHTVPGGG